MVEAYHLVASQLDYSLYSADYIDYILGLQLLLSSKRQLSCNIQHILTELVELQQTQISHVVAGSLVQHLKADVIIHLWTRNWIQANWTGAYTQIPTYLYKHICLDLQLNPSLGVKITIRLPCLRMAWAGNCAETPLLSSTLAYTLSLFWCAQTSSVGNEFRHYWLTLLKIKLCPCRFLDLGLQTQTLL